MHWYLWIVLLVVAVSFAISACDAEWNYGKERTVGGRVLRVLDDWQAHLRSGKGSGYYTVSSIERVDGYTVNTVTGEIMDDEDLELKF